MTGILTVYTIISQPSFRSENEWTSVRGGTRHFPSEKSMACNVWSVHVFVLFFPALEVGEARAVLPSLRMLPPVELQHFPL